MKTAFSLKGIVICGLLLQSALQFPQTVSAQGIHFSQYYNAPMLTNPANTGLMSDKDYRVGANYRSQWSSVPVPYHTFSVYGDIQVFRAHNQTNWLGLGGAVFSDKAGDGNLSLTRYEAFASYHLELGEYQMVSVGLSAASVERSLDFNKLTWDSQWDGFNFDNTLANGEVGALSKTKYLDVTAGVNYAIYPTELVYIKIGVGMAHVNQPKESFFGYSNQLGMRPTANVDVLARIGTNLIFNPSVYYTNQKSASEIMYGTLFTVLLGGESAKSSIILGAYHRWNDAIVGVFGYGWGNLRVMTSYDYTISALGDYINHNGALEFGLRWDGLFKNEDAMHRRSLNCPRF